MTAPCKHESFERCAHTSCTRGVSMGIIWWASVLTRFDAIHSNSKFLHLVHDHKVSVADCRRLAIGHFPFQCMDLAPQDLRTARHGYGVSIYIHVHRTAHMIQHGLCTITFCRSLNWIVCCRLSSWDSLTIFCLSRSFFDRFSVS